MYKITVKTPPLYVQGDTINKDLSSRLSGWILWVDRATLPGATQLFLPQEHHSIVLF